YGQLLQRNSARAVEITNDPQEKATRALWKKDADELDAKLKAGGLSKAEKEKLTAAQKIAAAQASAPAAPDKNGQLVAKYLQVPTGYKMWNFLALTFCLMVGTAGLPHILTRYYTTPSVRQARTSVGWSLFFIFLLYFTAPAYAAFARFAIYAKLVGTHVSDLPRWVTLWKPAGLFDVVDKAGDGIVNFADFVVKSTDFVVLATPEIAGLPFVITGLVMAGGLAAALSTADGLLLTIANAFSHDLYYSVIDPKASLMKRLTVTKVLLVVTALIAASVATFRLAIIVELVAWAFSLGGAAFFPALVMGIWWKRANRAGALAGMLTGFLITLYYMVGSRFFGVSWFQTATIASGIFGIPLGFIMIWIVSLATKAPSVEIQQFVANVRYPESGKAKAPPTFGGKPDPAMGGAEPSAV
ncbi:MAG: VC_2705 family sodium/solute symporter, partial [Acidobacteriota bacterium]|nr:VC_2705 family sodium/solute symporter [Acidobacteriota bacterium]